MKRRAGIALLALIVLSACLSPNPDSASKENGKSLLQTIAEKAIPRSTPLTKASLAGGDLLLKGPDGYCIDKESLASGRTRSFALLGLCTVMAELGTSGKSPALLTVAVAPNKTGAAAPSPEAIANGLGAPLVGKSTEDGVSLAHLGRHGDDVLPNGDAAHWRAAFAHNGLMIGIGLYAPDNSRMTSQAGADLIRETVANIRALNPEQIDTSDQTAPKARGLASFFRKSRG